MTIAMLLSMMMILAVLFAYSVCDQRSFQATLSASTADDSANFACIVPDPVLVRYGKLVSTSTFVLPYISLYTYILSCALQA